MTYRETPTAVPGVALWTRTADVPGRTLILPDGCLDLVWSDGELRVAGPDSAARHHHDGANGEHAGLRFARGLGPALVGVPADALRDTAPALADLWGARRAGALAARVDAVGPARALAGWLAEQHRDVDPFGARVFDGLGRGMSVGAVADRLGCSARTLHRRSAPVFGYGPQHLARVLRLQRALAAARAGHGWADAAASAGYADQPHLARETRALAGTTPTALVAQPGSGANRSTGEPSGSCTTA